jgi:hypothetical protein
MASAYRFVFPPPPYYAYIPGAVPPPVPRDTRPATDSGAYPKAVPIPVNPPPPQAIHVEDINPRVPVFVSPYPVSTHKVVPEPKVVHVEDQPGSKFPRRR